MKRILFAVILTLGLLAVRQSMASDPIMGRTVKVYKPLIFNPYVFEDLAF